MRPHFLLLPFLVLATAVHLHGQSLYVLSVDTTQFPVMSAKFFAFDTSGARVSKLQPADVLVHEDGIPRAVTSIDYCDVVTEQPLSVGLLVDTHSRIDLARAGTSRLINFLGMPPSEVGITTMDHGVYVVQDFTRKRSKALAAAQRLNPAPGVDLQSMFYDPLAGGVPFITGREHKKILVLITDLHCPVYNLDTNRLFADAARENISIFTVIIGTTDYGGLFRRIAKRTQGEVFENVRSETQIKDIFQQIAIRNSSEPCGLTWISDTLCARQANVIISIPSMPAATGFAYTRPTGLNPRVLIRPSTLLLRGLNVGVAREAEVTISAYDADLRVDAITVNNPALTIVDYDGVPPPFIIPVGASRTIRVRCTLLDSENVVGQLLFTTNACAATNAVVYGIQQRKQQVKPTLRLVAPNGGEEFAVGNDTVIRWTGIDSSEIVSLEYSIDAGASWIRITDSAMNLLHPWHVPNTPSRRCLARVTQQAWDRVGDTMVVIPTVHNQYGFLRLQSWSPDGANLLTYTDSARFNVWDAATGVSLLEIPGLNSSRGVTEVMWSPVSEQFVIYSLLMKPNHQIEVWDMNRKIRVANIGTYQFDMRWSPDGKFLAIAVDDTLSSVWDAQSGTRLSQLYAGKTGLNMVRWNSDGTRIAGAGVGVIYIFDPATGDIVDSLWQAGLGLGASMSWAPQNDLIAMGTSEGYVHVWDLVTRARVAKLTGHSQVATHIGFSSSGGYLATCSRADRMIVWDAADFSKILEVPSAGNPVACAWSPSDDRIAVGSGPDGDIIIRAIPTGDTLHQFKGIGSPVLYIDWSPDGARLAARYDNGSTRVWLLPSQPLQQDTSDTLWAIVAPRPDLRITDVDMGVMEVGKMRDSLVVGVICNSGKFPVHVLGVDVTTGSASDFMIPFGAGDFMLEPGACRDLLFEFMPTATGYREARATLRTSIDTLRDTILIHGVGVAPSLEVLTPTIDFGTVRIKEVKDSAVAVVLRNVGSSSVTIDATEQLGPDTTQFSVVTGGGAFTLAPGEHRPMQLRFQPTATGRASGRIAFNYNGPGSPAVARLFGRGLAGQVDVPSDSAAPGARLDLPLRISNTGARAQQTAAQPFRAYLQVDQALLAPVDPSIEIDLVDGIRTIMVSGSWDGTSDTLGLIPMVALLGDTTSCSITLLSFDWLDNTGQALDFETETRSGRFTLIDICREGGERLYDQQGVPSALKVVPNPVDERTSIAYNLAEDGNVTITIFDGLGRTIRRVLEGHRSAGEYRIGVATKGLPAGTYQVIMRTPTQVVSTRMEIVR